MSLTKRAGKGASWQLLGGMAQTIVRIGAAMVLARHLTPDDFGIFIMATLIYGLFELMSAGGMTTGIMVKDKPDEKDLATCFWLLLSIRVALTAISIVSAPYIAIMMGIPEAAEPLQAISILIFISGIGALPQTLLAKKLDFKKIMLIKLSGTFLESALAVILVLSTELSYWSLIIAMIIAHTFISLGFLIAAKWMPKILFAKDRLSYLLNYGLNNLGTAFATYLSSNIDNIVVAKVLGAQSLGYYDFAYRAPQILNERITGPLGGVAFSMLAEIKAKNSAELLPAYTRIVKYIAWLSFPAFTGLAVLSHDVVSVLWGDQWLEIVPAMQILCAVAGVHSLISIANYLYFCHERPDLPFKFSLFNLLVTACFVPVFAIYYGIVGVAIAMLISKLCLLVSPLYAIKKYGGSIKNFLFEIGKPAFSSMVMGAAVYFLHNHEILADSHSLVILVSLSVTGAIVYLATVFIFFKSDFVEIVETIKKVIK